MDFAPAPTFEDEGNIESQTQETEIELPTPEQYTQAHRELAEVKDEKDQVLAEVRQAVSQNDPSKNEIIATYNRLNAQYNRLGIFLEEAEDDIINNTNAVKFEGDLIVLEGGADRNGQPIIRVRQVFSSDTTNSPKVRQGQAFRGDLSNAPEEFRNAMYSGPFVINADGTLDVTQRYDQIPYTE